MGAVPYTGGVTFRVWAPFATAVHIAGTFNAWSDSSTPLSAEGNGNWSTDVDAVSIGAQYKFVITSPFSPTPLWKNDPYAREMTNSAGNSVIAATDFGWDTDGYQMPAWN